MNPPNKFPEGVRRGAATEVAVGLTVVAATAIVFVRMVGFGFIGAWDDAVFAINTDYQGLGWKQLKWMFTTAQFPAFYIPLSWLSWGFNYLLFGLSPMGFHLGDFLLHLANALMVLFLIREFLSLGAEGWTNAPSDLICAGLGALFWSLHPLRAEPVASVVLRPVLLSTFFMLFSLVAYLRASRPPKASVGKRSFYCASLLAYVASLLSYPLAVGCFALFPILDFYPLKQMKEEGIRRGSTSSVGNLWLKAPFVFVGLVSGIASILTSKLDELPNHSQPSLREFGVAQRFMQGCYSLAYYSWVILYPKDLSPIYTRLISFNPVGPLFLLSAAWVLTTTFALWFFRRRWPIGWALWLCNFFTLLPVLGLTQSPHYTNDHTHIFKGSFGRSL